MLRYRQSYSTSRRHHEVGRCAGVYLRMETGQCHRQGSPSPATHDVADTCPPAHPCLVWNGRQLNTEPSSTTSDSGSKMVISEMLWTTKRPGGGAGTAGARLSGACAAGISHSHPVLKFWTETLFSLGRFPVLRVAGPLRQRQTTPGQQEGQGAGGDEAGSHSVSTRRHVWLSQGRSRWESFRNKNRNMFKSCHFNPSS